MITVLESSYSWLQILEKTFKRVSECEITNSICINKFKKIVTSKELITVSLNINFVHTTMHIYEQVLYEYDSFFLIGYVHNTAFSKLEMPNVCLRSCILIITR